METIYIRKQPKPDAPGEFHYVVPAVGIKTRDGMRLIPHPYGTETTAFDTLEATIENVHRAGYAVEFEGKHYAAPSHKNLARPRIQPRTPGSAPVLRMIEDAIPLLHEQLTDSTPSVIASAAFALGELRDASAISGLIHALGNDDATVRKNAAEALAKIGKPSMQAISHALKDKNWVVRHSGLAAILELIHLRFDMVVDVLSDARSLLKDESWLVRSQAATVFGEAAKVFYARQEKENNAGPIKPSAS